MGRLTRLGSRIGTLKPRISVTPRGEAERSRQRDAERPSRKWYKTARWQRLRKAAIERDGYQCQMPGCGRIEHDTSRLVGDHRRPHDDDPALFWDFDNVQTLCKPCHDSRKQSEERRWRAGGGGGAPLPTPRR